MMYLANNENDTISSRWNEKLHSIGVESEILELYLSLIKTE